VCDVTVAEEDEEEEAPAPQPEVEVEKEKPVEKHEEEGKVFNVQLHWNALQIIWCVWMFYVSL